MNYYYIKYKSELKTCNRFIEYCFCKNNDKI